MLWLTNKKIIFLVHSLNTDFFIWVITFTKSLDPDQDRQNVGPDLDVNHLTLIVFQIDFFEKVIFKKRSIILNAFVVIYCPFQN